MTKRMTSMSSKLEAATGVNIAGRRTLGVGSPASVEESAGDFEVDLFLSTGMVTFSGPVT